jgi:hypothetical protein
MNRPSILEAVLVGSLTAVACLCAVRARGETYSIVAQSDESTAATGHRPLARRIASARLPHMAADDGARGAASAARRTLPADPRVAQVPRVSAGPGTASAAQRSSGNGLSSSSPAAVTR